MLVFEIQVLWSNINSSGSRDHTLISLTRGTQGFILLDEAKWCTAKPLWNEPLLKYSLHYLNLPSAPPEIILCRSSVFRCLSETLHVLNQLTKLLSECPDLLAGWEERLLCVWQDLPPRLLPVHWFNLFGNMRIGVFSPFTAKGNWTRALELQRVKLSHLDSWLSGLVIACRDTWKDHTHQ